VSVFALTVEDAGEVAHVLAGFDAGDPYARVEAARWDPRPGLHPPRLRVALPAAAQRPLDAQSQPAFERARAALDRMGGSLEEIDFAPFTRAAALLYEGPWVAERLEAAGDLLARDPEAIHPAVREIFQGAARYGAVDVFGALHALEALRAQADALFARFDLLLVPTAPTRCSPTRCASMPSSARTRTS
jgi:allophanate hydrolase